MSGFAEFCAVCQAFVELPPVEPGQRPNKFYAELKTEYSKCLCLFFLFFPQESKRVAKIITSDSLVSFCDRCATLLKEWDHVREQFKSLERRAKAIHDTLTAVIIQATTQIGSRYDKNIVRSNEKDRVPMETKVKIMKQLVFQGFSPSVSLGRRCDDRSATAPSHAVEDSGLASVTGSRKDGLSEAVEDAIPPQPKRRRKAPVVSQIPVDSGEIEATTFGTQEQTTLEELPTIPEANLSLNDRPAVFPKQTTTKSKFCKPPKKITVVVKKPKGLSSNSAIPKETALEEPPIITPEPDVPAHARPAASHKKTYVEGEPGKPTKTVVVVKRPKKISNDSATPKSTTSEAPPIVTLEADVISPARPSASPKKTVVEGIQGKPSKKVLVAVKKPLVLPNGKYRLGGKHYVTIKDGRCHCDTCPQSFATVPEMFNHIMNVHHAKSGRGAIIHSDETNVDNRSLATEECLPPSPALKENLTPPPNTSLPTTSGGKDMSKPTTMLKSALIRQVEPGTYVYSGKYEISLQPDGNYMCQTCKIYVNKLLSRVGRHIKGAHARVKKEKKPKTKEARGEPRPRRRPTKPRKPKSPGVTIGETSKLIKLVEPGKYLHREEYEIRLVEDGDEQLFVCSTCGKYRSLNLKRMAWHIDGKHVEHIRNRLKEQYRQRSEKLRSLKWIEESPGKYTCKYREVSIQKQENGELVCLKCGHTASTEPAIKIHVGMSHTTVQKRLPMAVKCIAPNKYEYDGRTFTRHPNPLTFTCDLCSFTRVGDRKPLILHLISAHGAARPRPVSIDQCKRDKPVAERKPKSPSWCPKCNKSYTSLFGLYLHKRNVHGPISFICELCGRGFKTNLALKSHSEIHLPAEERLKYQCEHCGNTYLKKTTLDMHRKLKHEGELLSCGSCDQKFPTKFQRLMHQRVVHKGLSRMFTCQFCAKEFRSEPDWRYHEKAHTGVTFDCAECDLKFSTASRRRNHVLKVHRQEPSRKVP